MVLTPRPDRPIDPITLSVIREVASASAHLGLQVFMVGATARIILLEHVFGLHTGRATRDIDFAFALENWAQFQALKQYLILNSGFEEMVKVEHRLHYQQPGIVHKFVIDLIPFGGIEGEKNIIAWPPGMSVLMNVVGFADAHASAENVEVEPGLVIAIASIPGIAILKLFAWVDRGCDDPKDALDLVTLLRQYNEAGNQDRIYTDAIIALETEDYDVELAGAWLLGTDVKTIASIQTRNQMNELFARESFVERLVTDMSRAMRSREDALDYSRALLMQFVKGFAH